MTFAECMRQTPTFVHIKTKLVLLRIWCPFEYDMGQTDIFIDGKKVNPDFFVIEIREKYVHAYTTLVIC